MTVRTTSQLFDLKGRTALITGGSRGLGLQIAHALGEAGAKVMLSARKEGELEEARHRLPATVDAVGFVEHTIFGEDLVYGRAATHGVNFPEDVVKIAGQ